MCESKHPEQNVMTCIYENTIMKSVALYTGFKNNVKINPLAATKTKKI